MFSNGPVSPGGGVEKETLYRWWQHPANFVEQVFRVTPDAWQVEALEAFPHVNRLAMKACKGPGKTATEAWLALNFMTTRPMPRINYTSITGDNTAANLSPELGKWIGMSPFLSSIFQHTATAVRHRAYPRTWYALARTWPKKADKQAQSDALAGLHGDYAMWILDESGGIPVNVLVSAEAVLASGIETKVVQGGNPTSLQGALYHACVRDAHLWKVVTITGDPDDPQRSPRISMEWAKQQIKSFGRDNPWVMVNVLGKFPPGGLNTLVDYETFQVAVARRLKVAEYAHMQKRLGIDVARFGDDRTCFFPRQGLQALKPSMMRNARTTDIAARAAQIELNWMRPPYPPGRVLHMVDDTGHWGHGVVDQLIVGNHRVVPIVYSDKALNPRYLNRRAEMYLQMAEAIKGGTALPDDAELREELTTITYSYNNGTFFIEPKEQVKERLGRSPDKSDALAQTYAMPDIPEDIEDRIEAITGRRARSASSDGRAGRVSRHDDYEE